MTLAISRENHSLVTSQDLGELYKVYPNGGEVPLWFEGVSETGNSDGRSTGKRSKDADSSKCCLKLSQHTRS